MSNGLGITPEDVLYKWSYENLLLMSRATPSYNTKEEDKKTEWDETKDANNPENFSINENSNIKDEEFII